MLCGDNTLKHTMWHSMSSSVPVHHEVQVVAAGLHAQVLAHELGILEEVGMRFCPGLRTVAPSCDLFRVRVQGLGSGALGRGPNRLERNYDM